MSRLHLNRRAVFVLVVLLAMVVLTVGYGQRHFIKAHVMEVQAHQEPMPTAEFPVIDTAGFTPAQTKLLDQLKAEYAKHPVSFDANVLRYTDGAEEPWCADFVSWNMRELGQPLVNPNSHSWRIPGVYTLREYYQSTGRWNPSGSYIPKFGDVAIYAKSPAQSHTNFVIAVDTAAQTMTTIGGNEEGHIKIKTKSYLPPHEDLAGFGTLR
jgi:hypothetical protein